MGSLLLAQVNLAFQAAVFILLVVGFLFVRRKKIRAHAQIMLAAVVLTIVSFLGIMAPSLMNISSSAKGTPLILAMIHGTIGGLVLLLSLWVVGVWLMSPFMVVPIKIRCNSAFNKRLMSTIIFLWLASLILGVVLYIALHA